MKTVRTVAVACAMLAVVLLAPATASASTSGSTGVSSGLVPVFDDRTGTAQMLAPAQASAVIDRYWTPDRLATAIPMPGAVPTAKSPAHKTPKRAPHRVAAPVPPVSRGNVMADSVNVTQTEGRAFFHNPADGNNYSCSGGAVNSGKRRLVLTAGHCVHGGPGGQWMQNWRFFPGYEFGAGPTGEFDAYQLWTETGWINNGDNHYDYAFAIMQNNAAGLRIVDAVGGNGLILNPGRPFIIDIGYPDNVANNQAQANCSGQLSRRSIISSDQKLDCNMGNGASGSPFLENYSNSTGLGDAVSDLSYGINPDPLGPVFGPYYDDETGNLYNTADNASP